MSISTGTMSVSILAILTGLVGAYVFRSVMLNDGPAGPKPPRAIQVPLATADLPAGRTVALGDIGLVSMTREEMKEQNMPLGLVMTNAQQIVGRTLRTGVQQGRPFLTTAMYLDGSQPDLAELLKPGFRAVTLEIPDVRGGNVTANSSVDVLFRTASQAGDKGVERIPETTLTLIEGAEVLRVDRPKLQSRRGALDIRRRPTAPRPPMITLAVTLQQAAVLQTVEGRGELSLVTRAHGETLITSGRSQRMTLEGLLGLAPYQPAQPFSTEIYRRGAKEAKYYDRSTMLPPKQDQARIEPLYPPIRSSYHPIRSGMTAGILDVTQDKVTAP